MEPKTARRKLKKLLGSRFAWREDSNAPTPAQRAALDAAFPLQRAERDVAKAALEAKRRELLSDPLYIHLRAEYERLEERVKRTGARRLHKRICVGLDMGFAFSVFADADTWAEAVREVEAKHASGESPV